MDSQPRTNQSSTALPGGRSRGETTGTAERPAQRVSALTLRFDLSGEVERLHAEKAWRDGERNATTLVKEPGLRIVLTTLRAGGRVREHSADATVAIHVISGEISVHLPAGPVKLPAGHLLTLEPGVQHEVEGIQESAFLVTLGGA